MATRYGLTALTILAAFVLCVGPKAKAAALPPDECNISGNASPKCSPACKVAPFTVLTGDAVGGLRSGGNVYDAAKSDHGSATCPVDIWNELNNSKSCRYVDNNSSPATSIFVPFRTKEEWKAFIDPNNTPPFISIEHCTRGLATSIPPDPQGNCRPVPPATSVPPVQISLPYARFDKPNNKGASPVTETVTFSCLDTNNNPWTEQAQQTFTALDSDDYPPGWQGGPIAYSSAPANGNCAARDSGSNCDRYLPASNNGTACTERCMCWLQDLTYTWTCMSGTWTETSVNIGPCFLGDTPIMLADGSTKPVTELKPGDVVRGKKGNNTVLYVPSHINHGAIYGFNGGKPFVTGGHPFWTKDGWKAIDPALTPAERHGVIPTKLQVGDELWLSDGKRLKITSIDAHDMGPQPVYNPGVDGDHTYYANSMLVHNYADECPYGQQSLICN